MFKKLTSIYFLLISCLCCAFALQAQADAFKENSTPTYPRIRYVDNNGVRIAYTSSGKHHKQSIVFIHGFPFSGQEFICQIDFLKRFFHVVTVDLRGFGSSDKSLTIPYNYPAYVSDVTAVINKLGLRRPTIVGFSFGSIVAELYAETNPNISRLILISPFAGQVLNVNGYTLGLDPAVLAPLIPLLETDRNAFNRAFADAAVNETCKEAQRVKRYLLPIEEQVPTANINKMLAENVFATGFPEITNSLPAITVPTLILQGKIDILNNIEGVFALNTLIPNSLLLEFPGGHMINLTQSRDVNQAIFDFMKKNFNNCQTCL